MVEFEYAHPGMVGLETVFGVLRTCLPELSLEKIIELICLNPRRIFDLEKISVKQDEQACLSIFLPDEKWKADRFHSRSKNSAFTGMELMGRPLGIINKDKLFLNQ